MNFLFSPNFERYIDVNWSKKKFEIREVALKGMDKENLKYVDIPKDIINIKELEQSSAKEGMRYMGSRMMLVTKDIIRIILYNGLDCLFEIPDIKEWSKDDSNATNSGSKKYFKLLTYTKLDNYPIGKL